MLIGEFFLLPLLTDKVDPADFQFAVCFPISHLGKEASIPHIQKLDLSFYHVDASLLGIWLQMMSSVQNGGTHIQDILAEFLH